MRFKLLHTFIKGLLDIDFFHIRPPRIPPNKIDYHGDLTQTTNVSISQSKISYLYTSINCNSTYNNSCSTNPFVEKLAFYNCNTKYYCNCSLKNSKYTIDAIFNTSS